MTTITETKVNNSDILHTSARVLALNLVRYGLCCMWSNLILWFIKPDSLNLQRTALAYVCSRKVGVASSVIHENIQQPRISCGSEK